LRLQRTLWDKKALKKVRRERGKVGGKATKLFVQQNFLEKKKTKKNFQNNTTITTCTTKYSSNSLLRISLQRKKLCFNIFEGAYQIFICEPDAL